MSATLVKQALETALAAITPALDTAWPNVPYTPVTGVAYQVVRYNLTEPENPMISGGLIRLNGFMQIDLRYPQKVGTSEINARADLIAETFYHGATFTAGGVEVIILRTPTIHGGATIEDRYVVAVDIRFFADY